MANLHTYDEDDDLTLGRSDILSSPTPSKPKPSGTNVMMENAEVLQALLQKLYPSLKEAKETKEGLDTWYKSLGMLLEQAAREGKKLNEVIEKTKGTVIQVKFADGTKEQMDNYLSQLDSRIKGSVDSSAKVMEVAVKPAVEKIIKNSIEVVDKHCDSRIHAVKKKMGAGHWMSSTNYWLMLVIMWVSASYALYTAWDVCLWGEVWNRIWLPVCMVGGLVMLLILHVWLSLRDSNPLGKY